MSGSVESWSSEGYARQESWNHMDVGRRSYSLFTDRARQVSFPDAVWHEIGNIEKRLTIRRFSEDEREYVEEILKPSERLSIEDAKYALAYMGTLIYVQDFPDVRRQPYLAGLQAQAYLFNQLSVHTGLAMSYAETYDTKGDDVARALRVKNQPEEASRLEGMVMPMKQTIFKAKNAWQEDMSLWTNLYTAIGRVRQREKFEYLAPNGYHYSEIRQLVADRFPRNGSKVTFGKAA